MCVAVTAQAAPQLGGDGGALPLVVVVMCVYVCLDSLECSP